MDKTSPLVNYLHQYFRIPAKSIETVAALFDEERLEKGTFFIKQGYYASKLSFVQAGYLRVFTSTENKEVTQWISEAGYFLTDLASLFFNAPAKWNIQALTDCLLYTITQENYNKIEQLVPEWGYLERQFLAHCFSTLEDRVFTFLSMSSEERYLDLWQRNPNLFNQVPLHYLASMLGMSPETLSRIRKKIAKS